MVCPATRAGSTHGHNFRLCTGRGKRTASVDVEKIKAELRAEVTEDIMTMLAAQGLQIQPISRNPSPAPGRRSSCASASDLQMWMEITKKIIMRI